MSGWVREPSIQVCAVECGSRCCKEPGYIALTLDEAETLHEDWPKAKFRPEVTNAAGVHNFIDTERVYFLFADNGGQCPYLDDAGACGIHDMRPEACRTFPDYPAEYCLVWPKVQAVVELGGRADGSGGAKT